MKVLFLTNYASPYKVAFFDCLASFMDVTVLLCERTENMTHRDAGWFEAGTGSAEFINLEPKYIRNRIICPDVVNWLRRDFDRIVICGYAKSTQLLALAWLKLHRKPYCFEVDGGLIRQDKLLQRMLKTWAVKGAQLYLSSGPATTDYLVHYGAKRERVREYPFSSLHQQDFPTALPTREEKLTLRRELSMEEETVVLSVGQFIHRKGYDVLMQAARELPKSVGIYIVGSNPTEEYLRMQKEWNLTNVHFVGFRKKPELAKYYRAADLFCLPTREDIWGLVINEAMAYGLPVVTTDRCVAGLDLVEENVNGHIVPVDNPTALAEKITHLIGCDCAEMGRVSAGKAEPFTIENMAKRHAEILK